MDRLPGETKQEFAKRAEKEPNPTFHDPDSSFEGFTTKQATDDDVRHVPPTLRGRTPEVRRAQAKMVLQHDRRWLRHPSLSHLDNERFGDTAKELGNAVADVERQKNYYKPVVKESKALRNLQYILLEADVENIEKKSVDNNYFRHVLYTSKNMQLVVMSLKPGEDIGEEVHKDTDQFFRVEEGNGRAVLDGKAYSIKSGTSVLVPKGTKHNIKNSSDKPLKLYTIYSPPKHKDGTIHKTKKDADRN